MENRSFLIFLRVRLISNQRIELFLFLSIFFLETLVVLKRMSTFVVYYYTNTHKQ